jgi:hypothetical protein
MVIVDGIYSKSYARVIANQALKLSTFIYILEMLQTFSCTQHLGGTEIENLQLIKGKVALW